MGTNDAIDRGIVIARSAKESFADVQFVDFIVAVLKGKLTDKGQEAAQPGGFDERWRRNDSFQEFPTLVVDRNRTNLKLGGDAVQIGLVNNNLSQH